jgi:pyrroline-5-carboxylate reductase
MKNIGIIGYGNMGSAIAERAKSSYGILVFDKDTSKTAHAKGLHVIDRLETLVDKSDAIILAVKPQDFDVVLAEIGSAARDKLVISIAAGIETKYIEQRLKGSRVVRVMPNLPARVGKGMSCIAKGHGAADTDVEYVVGLFSVLGNTAVIDENMMDEATAVSGSGPGFAYDLFVIEQILRGERRRYVENSFIPELMKAAIEIGFPSDTAKTLAITTGRGCLEYLEVTGLDPSDALAQVKSKGGTTEAGVNVLKGLPTLVDAVRAAVCRAKELARS